MAIDLQPIVDRLRQLAHHDAVVETDTESVQPSITVRAGLMDQVARCLRDELGFDRLLNVSGVDHEGYDDNGKGKHRKIAKYAEDGTVEKVTEPATGDFSVVYHLQNFSTRELLTVRVRVPREAPVVQSVTAVWSTALWGERETYDMYGIEFEGHPDLRRILLPEDWTGHPLRKDYEMPARYHDVPLEGLPLSVRQQQEAEAEASRNGGDAQ